MQACHTPYGSEEACRTWPQHSHPLSVVTRRIARDVWGLSIQTVIASKGKTSEATRLGTWSSRKPFSRELELGLFLTCARSAM